MKAPAPVAQHRWRYGFVLGGVAVAAALLVWRAADLQVLDNDFLQHQGDARYLRTVAIPSHRGMITDRNGEPLAISTPVDSVWANPQALTLTQQQWSELGKLLTMSPRHLQQLVDRRTDREFVYLKRHVNPELARAVNLLDLPGIALRREYHRYYPAGEVTAHVIGFTNVDDEGQEGLELAYDQPLRGVPGRQQVIKDRLGRVVEHVDLLQDPDPGKDLALGIDRRIQFIAYRELKAAVQANKAKSGSAVVVDVRTGEILAMVNQPSFNPHNRGDLRGDHYRNRAVTDTFEPGSVMKPFTVAAVLKTGKFTPDTLVDTSPGLFRVGRNTIRDVRNYGLIDVATVIKKSSNVGASKMALSIPRELLWNTYNDFGFGAPTDSGFPGEMGGKLPFFGQWHDIDQATLSFGYGISVTTLQLAQAYTVLADGGYLRPLSFLRVKEPAAGKRVIDPNIARQIRDMLESVVGKGGTGSAARVPGYRVAGKTGTVRKSGVGGYVDDSYLAVFAGMAPASRPRLAMVVVVNEPKNGKYYGGQVAAPVFANVMAGALRLLDIAPDDVPGDDLRVAGLARISRHPSAAAGDLLAMTGRAPSSRFDVVSTTPAPSCGPLASSQRHLDARATNGGEKCGLGGGL